MKRGPWITMNGGGFMGINGETWWLHHETSGICDDLHDRWIVVTLWVCLKMGYTPPQIVILMKNTMITYDYMWLPIIFGST